MTCAPLWPTPLTMNRKSRKAMTASTENGRRSGGGNSSPPALEQAVEIVAGLDPKELPSVEEMPPALRALVEARCPCQCHTSTSSAAGSPARTSASPAEAKGSTGHARVFGASTPDSFATYDPATSSWRTSQLSLLEEWTGFSGTWPRAGMTRSGTASLLVPSAPLTGGTASGLLPTPSATPYGSNQGGGAGRVGPVRHSLQSMASKGLLPPGGMWRTPQTGEANGGGQDMNERAAQGHSVYLRDQMKTVEGSGQLNPTWVEWLMGFPSGWTDLGPSVTPLSPRSQSTSDDGLSNSNKESVVQQLRCEWCDARGRDVERVEVVPGTREKLAIYVHACCVHAEHARERWTDVQVKLRRPARNVEQRSIFDVLHETPARS
jgi:hypothetical protein